MSAEDTHEFSAITTLLFAAVLGVSMIAGYFIKKHNFHKLPPSGASLIVGTIFGFLIMLISKDEVAVLKFNPEIFFFLLLPPIIFEAGYQLQRKRFFKNFSSIIMFAGVGTLLSTITIGLLTYVAATWGMIAVDTTSPLEALMFGALISSVDPVATLSILGNPDLNCDPTLYSLIFGESVLNDAVCIVLFRTFQAYAQSSTAAATSIFSVGDFFVIILNFFIVTTGSILVGAITALGCSFLFKHTSLKLYPGYEITVLLIFPYVAFALGEALGLSGIMALFLSGVILSHYNVYNLSEHTQIASTQIFEALSLATETLTFAYMGIVLFTGEFIQWDPAFIFLAIAFCLIGRAINIFPLSFLTNFGRKKKITPKMQFVIWFAGLRGAIPFALAFNMPQISPMWNREIIVTTTLSVCIITTLVLGGLTEPLLKRMNLSAVEEEEVSDDEGYASLAPGREGEERIGGIHKRWKVVDASLMKIFANRPVSVPIVVHVEEEGQELPTRVI